MAHKRSTTTNYGDGGDFFKSQKTNEGFDSVRKIFDGSFSQAFGLPAFVNCTSNQLCDLKVFEDFAKHIKSMKQRNGDRYAPKTLAQYFSGFKNMVQNKFKSEKPSLFNVENKDDFNEHCQMLTSYLKRTATKEAWATGENAEKTVPSCGRIIIDMCCRLLLQDCARPGAGTLSNPHTLRFLMSCVWAGAGRAAEGVNFSYKGMQLDLDNGPVTAKWKEDKLALEKPMTFFPDAKSYYMCVIHSWASYLVLGPEEDPNVPLLLFPKTASLKQPYRVMTSIFKSLSKRPDAKEVGMTDAFTGISIRKGASRMLSVCNQLTLAHCCARSGHEFDKDAQSSITFFIYAINATEDYAMTMPAGLCLAGYHNCTEKVFCPRLDHISFAPEEHDMINLAMAKLFHIPPLEEFKEGGMLRPVLKTLLASLLQHLPQMEKDFNGSDHQLTHKIWTSMLAAKFPVARVREISSLIAQDISLRNAPAMQFKNSNSLETDVVKTILYGQSQILKEMKQLREDHSNLLAHITKLCDAQEVMANDVTQIVYSPSPSSPSFSSKRKQSTEKLNSSKRLKEKGSTISVNDKISAAALQTDAGESGSSITLSSLLLIAKEKGAFITDNYQLMLGWNKRTKEKAKRVIAKMMELMDEDEKQAIISEPIPMGDGDAYENWKNLFKEKAIAVEKKFLNSLTERYDKLGKPYNDGPGISRVGGNYFVGAANRDSSITTAENKVKKETVQQNDVTRKEARATFFTRGKVNYD